jgi:methylmalonyl-CoA mutase
MEEKIENLFDGFPPVNIAEWDARIREDLKGADYEKKLIWKTQEGFNVKPFYTAGDLKKLQYLDQEPGRFPYVRGDKTTGNAWEIRQDFKVSDLVATVLKIRSAIGNGITSLGLDLVNGENLSYDDFKELIRELDLNCISLNFISGTSPEILGFLLNALHEFKINPEMVKGSVDFDPLGKLTTTGGYYASEGEDFVMVDKLLMTAENELPGFRVLPVNSFIFGNAGASAVQELAFGLAMASEYFTRLTDMGHHAGEIARHMQWNLGVGSNYFMEIAKVRSARLLFSNLLAAFDGGQKTAVFINSVTTDWNKTMYDPHVNILRLTTESMAAVLGGCNSLLVKPFDSWFREQGNFSERISRNIQFILKEESYFDKVVDPSAGSYYIESLSDALVEHAWQLFLKTEDSGGYIKAFTSDFIREELGTVMAKRHQMVASRREILVGTNQYPNFRETMKDQIKPGIVFPNPEVSKAKVTEPLRTGRAAQEFEKLRLAVENFPGGRPRVFMLTYGNLAMRLARSQFSGNFFACAGYEIIDNLGFKSAGEGVEAALRANAQIIVVCSSDEEYPGLVPAVFEKAQGKAIIVVAGAPACIEELKKLGITDFIHVRSNVLETLQYFHQRLGIEK